jgi:UDP:flavonoid glycosyltransferase YjiC (YdhE family)
LSRILLAWELGTGFGHLAPFLGLAPRLTGRGHELHVAAREIVGASRALDRLPVTLHQAPLCLNTYGGLQEPPLNYAEILMRYGYLDPDMLRAMITAWRSLLQAVRADVLLADHAPTALLAAQLAGVPTAVIGSPFAVPPEIHPTPNMRPWVQVPAARLTDSDARVLAAINAARPSAAQPVTALHQIFAGAAQFFLGLPETDPYGPRNAAAYLGLNGQSTGTAVPAWPDGTGKRVMVYLHADYPHIDAAMHALAASGARAIAYVLGADREFVQRFAALGVTVSPDPVDITRLLQQAELCVTHGPSTALAALQCGVPVLMLPKQLENFLFAQALQRLGVGQMINAEQADPDIKGALAEMLANPAYGLGARGIAERYRGAAVDTIAERVVARIEALATRRHKGPE